MPLATSTVVRFTRSSAGATRWLGIVTGLLAIGACGPEGKPPADPLTTARAALDDGLTKRALAAVGDAASGPALVVRMQALLELDEWGTFEQLLRSVPAGSEKAALTCLLGAARKDVVAERQCRTPMPGLDATLEDATVRALGRVLETEHRREEAELTLRNLAQKRPTAANRKAVVGLLERQGFVREAVDFLEAWLAAVPGDPTIELKLVRTLERKVRGDLLEKRAAEAKQAARRILELQPSKAQIRYFLADALELEGDKTAAEAERAAAKAAGATPPTPVDTMPGMEPEPGDDDKRGHP